LALAQRLSYSQISQIGKRLQDLAQEKKLDFLLNNFFDEEAISKTVTECFRPCLQEKMHNWLLNTPFSLSLDTSTLVGQNICVVKARYIKPEMTGNGPIFKPSQLQDKIVTVTALKESVDAKTMAQILKDKIFASPAIKSNFQGLTHDNARMLSGTGEGLIGLMRKDIPERFIFDINDPSHCPSFALKYSLKALPGRVMDFIDDTVRT